MKQCEKCNNKFVSDIDVCPLCGGALIDLPEAEAAAEVVPEAPAETPVEAAPETPAEAVNKKGSKKAGIIIAAVIAALVIGGIWYKNYTAPRTLIINGDASINVNAGESADLSVAAEGFDGDAVSAVEWTIQNPDIVTIEDGKVTGHYDQEAFSLGGSEDSCSTVISATLKDGLRTWNGDSTVFVHLVPQDFSNGQIFREPAGSRDSFVEVTAAADQSTYFYFKSQDDPDNDCSFIVEAGQKATIYMPTDTYEIYEAHGQTWYGTDIKFGPNTYYTKPEATLKFTTDAYWEIKLGEADGNTAFINIDEDDFPDA